MAPAAKDRIASLSDIDGTLKTPRAPHEKGRFAAFPVDRSSHPWLGAVGLAVAVGIAYFIAARLGLALRTQAEEVAAFWPAAGVAVGVLIVLGPSARLPVAVAVAFATITSNLLIARNTWLAFTFGFLNAGQALLTAWLIERRFGNEFKLADVPQVVGFLLAAAIGAALAALGAAVAAGLVGSPTSTLNVWRLWFASCSLGIVTVAPLVIGLGEARRELPARRELIEGAAGLGTLALLSIFLTALPQAPWAAGLPLALVFSVLLWVAVRCRPVFAAAAALIVALRSRGVHNLQRWVHRKCKHWSRGPHIRRSNACVGRGILGLGPRRALRREAPE